ncbi:MAG: hypothetical protein CXT77_04005 [uncultured DHVE6 group euryarchaeote]|jgi:hypothetical protein|nr:MAG: hypothetical protein CXT77_04005 [uncultured DHVE6 group euryarchaeote]
MKKGDALLTIVFSIIGAIMILIVGSHIFATTLNIVDDEDVSVLSMRQIATAVNSAEFGDTCASAELNLARNHKLIAKDKELALWAQKYDENGIAIDEEEKIEWIDLNMDGRIFCEDESPQCENTAEGLIINPNFDREIDQSFCVCNVIDIDLIFIPTPGIIIIPVPIVDTANFVVYPKGFFSVTCDNPVSGGQADDE